MLSTPKPNRKLGACLGEPSRTVSRPRDQSPGGASAGEPEEMSTRERAGSIIGGMVPRQSMSVGRGNPALRNSRDPRPVGDKVYMSQCARTITDFLFARNFPRTISYEKFLKEPMGKDFFDIFKFLMAQLDPQLEIEGKVDDEVPLIMRRLKYPVEVNRSKLQSICGPNTWPQLLAVLDWLISLIHVNESLIEPMADCRMGVADANGDWDADHHTLRTLHENYLQFLSGVDDNSVEERLRQIYEERIAAVQSEVDRLAEQTTGMETQTHEYRCEHERLLELQAAPRSLEIEADRLRIEIQGQDARAQHAEEETATVEAEEQAVLAETEALVVKAHELQEQVESQPYSKQDIERLKCERNHHRRMLEDLKSDGEKTEQGVWELGIEESRLEEAICRTVRYVNDKSETVESVVAAVGGPCGEELIVRVDLTEPTDSLAALDFSELGSRVEAAAEAHGDVTKKEESSAHEVIEEQRVVQEELSQKDREVQRLKVRVEQVFRIREEYRVWSDEHLDDARQTAEAAEDAVRQAATQTVAPTLRQTADVDEMRLRLNELKSMCESDKAVMEDKVKREQDARDTHQKNTHKELQATLEAMEALQADVEKRVAEMAGA